MADQRVAGFEIEQLRPLSYLPKKGMQALYWHVRPINEAGEYMPTWSAMSVPWAANIWTVLERAAAAFGRLS
jgi:hypothetical protein